MEFIARQKGCTCPQLPQLPQLRACPPVLSRDVCAGMHTIQRQEQGSKTHLRGGGVQNSLLLRQRRRRFLGRRPLGAQLLDLSRVRLPLRPQLSLRAASIGVWEGVGADTDGRYRKVQPTARAPPLLREWVHNLMSSRTPRPCRVLGRQLTKTCIHVFSTTPGQLWPLPRKRQRPAAPIAAHSRVGVQRPARPAAGPASPAASCIA